jgi:cobalamin biosynthesis protein CbiD
VESTFQRYKVRVNRSLDGKVMVPGSRGVGAVFSTKIPAKRGKPPVNRELRLEAGVAVFLTHLGFRIKS